MKNKSTGYRLHWEGSPDTPTAYKTMADVRTEIRKAAKDCGITIKQATKFAYIQTEAEYKAER